MEGTNGKAYQLSPCPLEKQSWSFSNPNKAEERGAIGHLRFYRKANK